MEETTELAHVHLGLEELGVGLVALTGFHSQLKVHLVGPPGSRVIKEEVGVTLYDGELPPEPIDPLPVCSLSPADCVNDLDADARASVESAKHLLITTSLGPDSLGDWSSLILELIDRRPAELLPGTVFIAVEDVLGPQGDDLIRGLRQRGVDCRSTVANRLCYLRGGWEPTSPGQENGNGGAVATTLKIHADRFAEWVIQGKPDKAILAALDDLDHIQFVDDIEPYLMRKRWIVDGAHLALAIWARKRGLPSMDQAVSVSDRRIWLGRFFAPLLETLHRSHPALDANAEYAYAHLDIWERHEHDIQRVLRSLQRVDLMPLFDDFERSLVDPLDAMRACGVSGWPELVKTFETFAALLTDIRQYSDQALVRSGVAVISADSDAAMIDRFRALAERILPEQMSEMWVGGVTRAFAHHRDRYAGGPPG